MKPVFIGSGVALITPFDKDGKIDFKGFEKLIEYHIENKTDAIIVCGTTGEGSTLTVYERLNLFSTAVEVAHGRIPVIGGTGSNSTSFSLSLIKEAEKTGIDAHLSVTPYYNKTSQEGLIKHYYALADEAEKPIIVYNVPSRTGMNILPETYKRLSEHNNICGVKEADTSIAKLIKSIRLCGDKLDFYIGNDDMICPAAACGCKGVISVLANVMPAFTHEMTYEGITGSTLKCREMQSEAMDLIEALFCDVNPIPVKYAMKYLDMDSGILRLPLYEMSEEKKERIRISLEAIKHKL
ncbi:MAG: 4-hydroxy-tetrahydrodipicolinate synthase [Clostridia bacterium]|nr:4-hydroxy-tetrahydrodipicolinate synthase [Clostridia bacterium]